jgi:MSHA pilin protein MshD
MVRKQALAVAESLMEEITLQPFTFCDPDDPAAPNATVAADCATPQNLGPTAGESRHTEPRYDNVGDYNSFAMNGGIMSLYNNATAISGLEGYNAAVTVTQDPRGATLAIPVPDSLRIDVTVTGPGGEAVTLTGYRFRYAPRAVP